MNAQGQCAVSALAASRGLAGAVARSAASCLERRVELPAIRTDGGEIYAERPRRETSMGRTWFATMAAPAAAVPIRNSRREINTRWFAIRTSRAC